MLAVSADRRIKAVAWAEPAKPSTAIADGLGYGWVLHAQPNLQTAKRNGVTR